MVMSRIHGLAKSVTVQDGNPPRRDRVDKSDFLTLIQGMKHGQWFVAPNGEAGTTLKNNVNAWNATGKVQAHTYRSADGRMVVICGNKLPELRPFKYPQINDGPPPERTERRKRKFDPFVDVLKSMMPGQWCYADIKPASARSIISRFTAEHGTVFKTFFTKENKLVIIREPE